MASTPSHTGSLTRGHPLIRTVTAVVGAVFLLVGVLGFVPGITTHYQQMSFAGHHSMAMLLSVFGVSVLHNIVHLLFGVAGLTMARTAPLARAYLVGGGLIYLVLSLYGVLIDQHSTANVIPINTADNWLHFILALGMTTLGTALGRGVTRTTHAR